MNTAVLVLDLANLALIGALPRVFFRPGRLNRRWWLTASPFFVAAATLGAGVMGFIEPVSPGLLLADLASVLLSVGSILLIGFTLGTHREPVSLWHQEGERPGAIVTRGAYAKIRHTFFAAFLLALLAVASAFPHWITFISLAFACVQLNRTAAAEEKMLLQSEVGREYAVYVARTGRFFPPIGRSVPRVRVPDGTDRPTAFRASGPPIPSSRPDKAGRQDPRSARRRT